MFGTTVCPELCVGGQCVAATCSFPEDSICSVDTRVYCGATGWAVRDCRAEESYCRVAWVGFPPPAGDRATCVPWTCTPDETSCADATTISVCDSRGVSDTTIPCNTGEVCSGGRCEPEPAPLCDEATLTSLIQAMVVAPIIPNVSVGGVPLWDANGRPVVIDDLFGLPADGKFCEPEGPYSFAGYYLYFWGPTNEIIITYDFDSRFVTGFWILNDYLGSMSGSYTREVPPSQVQIVAQLKERVSVGGVDLNNYPEWIAPANLNAMHRMIRESFFAAPPFPDSHDCVSSGICYVIYVDDPSNPAQQQTTLAIFRDSGVMVAYASDGYILEIDIEPAWAPELVSTTMLDLDVASGGSFDPGLAGPSCSFALAPGPTWSTFSSACLTAPELSRLWLDIGAATNAATVAVGPIDLSLLRDLTTAGAAPFVGGGTPAADDALVGLRLAGGWRFALTQMVTVAEMVPATVAPLYAARLEQLLRDAVVQTPGHPFETYVVNVPLDMPTTPQPLGPILDASGGNWVTQTIGDVLGVLNPFTESQVDLDLSDPLVFAEPLIDVVLAVFTYGASESAAFKGFARSADRERLTGRAHFTVGLTPMRVTIDYDLSARAIASLTLDYATSALDVVMTDLAATLEVALGAPSYASPYYELQVAATYRPAAVQQLGIAFAGTDAYAPGGNGIAIVAHDPASGLFELELVLPSSIQAGAPQWITAFAAGTPAEIGGTCERTTGAGLSEIIPADIVHLTGGETDLFFCFDLDGTIARVEQLTFKGEVLLCRGPEIQPGQFDELRVSYGDDLLAEITAWEARVGSPYADACRLAVRSDGDGNLTEVVAAAAKTSVRVSAGRAVDAAVWR